MAIPHKFRGELGGQNEGRIVVTRSLRTDFSYLDIYPSQQWERRARIILHSPIEGGNEAEVRDLLLANHIHPAQEQTLDGQGRILIPAEHRQYAGLSKDVVFTGDIEKFRLWSAEEWKRFDDHAQQNKGKLKAVKGLMF